MTSNLIIDLNKQTRETRIALLEDGNLVEFRSQRQNASFSVGDIYLGVVRKVMLNHNALRFHGKQGEAVASRGEGVER